MKHTKKILLLFFIIGFVGLGLSQNPVPPHGDGGTPGVDDIPVGGGAPLGGGITILLAAAGAYGFMKYKKKTPDYTVME